MTDWLHRPLAPMLAGASQPFDSDDYLFEIKWDGIRAIAFFGEGIARLQGRKLTDSTHRYPEVIQGLLALEGEGILDGELVVLDDEGRPDFGRVLVREQTDSLDKALLKAKKHPAVYMVFDVLYRNGKPLLDVPLEERKKILSRLLEHRPGPIVESTYVLRQGKAFFQLAQEKRLEGVMAKRRSSRYLPGERTQDWLKLKVRLTTHGIVVGTVHEGPGGRVKSLVLGAYDKGKLLWIGNVGSGLDQKTLEQLRHQLGPLKSPPPPDFKAEAGGHIEWMRPALVARIQYTEVTAEGRLRHPVFVGFVDKPPEGCNAPLRG